MRLAKFLTTVAVASLAVSPAMAASSASKLSVSKAVATKASTKSTKSNELAGAVVIGVLATVALIGGAIALADDNSDSN